MMVAQSDQSLLDEGQTERDFWDSEPRYSTTSALPPPLSLPPQPQPSLGRLIFARFLFVAILFAVLAPLAYQAATHFGWVRALDSSSVR